MTSRHTPAPVDPAGRQLAAGRDASIHAVGARVLRRVFDGRSMETESNVMEHVRAAGYPVPRVHRVGRGELELDRVTGPTMLEDLLHRPWRLRRHARLLADLQHRLHRIPASAWLRRGPVPGAAIVHLDLHPGNVILGPDGPVVIDWTHAARGPGAADTALTWTTLACFDHDASGLKAWVADTFRGHYLECFLGAAGREPARALLLAIVEYRNAHPQRARNIRPGERDALRRLAATGLGHAGADISDPRTPGSTVRTAPDRAAGGHGST